MSDHKEHLETLHEIRNIMERSSRFISLSGLSGVIAGITALAGAVIVFVKAGYHYDYITWYIYMNDKTRTATDTISFLIFVAVAVLVVSVGAGTLLTMRRARKKGQKIWDSTAKRLLINLSVPLVTGGFFCLILLKLNLIGLIAPCTLIFYGLALFSASKYTLNDIRYLGLSEIVLGLVSCLDIGSGLLFWALGFGILHIVYGTVMYFKYERNQ